MGNTTNSNNTCFLAATDHDESSSSTEPQQQYVHIPIYNSRNNSAVPSMSGEQSIQEVKLSLKSKIFLLLIPNLWLVLLIENKLCATFTPIFFLPTILLIWKWWKMPRVNAELDLIVRLYAIGFTTGCLVVLIIETLLTGIFARLCFIDQWENYRNSTDQRILNANRTFGYYTFFALTSYITASFVEESLKYWAINSVTKTTANTSGYLMYALAVALGFSTIENIGYLYKSSLSTDKIWEIAALAIFRVCISTPVHVMSGYLIGIGIIRRDLKQEPIKIWQILFLPVFYHGTFDVLLMIHSSLKNDELGGTAARLIVTLISVFVILTTELLTIRYQRKKYAINDGDLITLKHYDNGICNDHLV
ncbi:unnamed protein product [Didymodactylos carnosus]|uniref:Protease PrsW n=1 Tax=Didymodactylos carnosus TaxID=1234261 RepID=A0A8S2F0U6_9BILA|nr:unnamed protein product [Didymodactylos carnosus]CAF4132845.1 unnamed protein product [Didymodactylos carnosus]